MYLFNILFKSAHCHDWGDKCFFQRYAICVSQGQYCDICSAGESDRAHPITNAIDGTERWWQSPPLSRSVEYNEVNVTLDLGQVGLCFTPSSILLSAISLFISLSYFVSPMTPLCHLSAQYPR